MAGAATFQPCSGLSCGHLAADKKDGPRMNSSSAVNPTTNFQLVSATGKREIKADLKCRRKRKSQSYARVSSERSSALSSSRSLSGPSISLFPISVQNNCASHTRKSSCPHCGGAYNEVDRDQHPQPARSEERSEGGGWPGADADLGRPSGGNGTSLGTEQTASGPGPSSPETTAVTPDPDRFKIITATALAFVICNMDKVNMSVAVIPMSQQLGWSASTAGLVQSSFFCGYALSQLPGGWLARRFTGRTVLHLGVLLWSVGTALVPGVARFVPALLLIRLLIGLGEGVAPPAATDLIARTVPAEERSRAVATVFGGLNVGSVLGLILAPLCIEHLGWESVFYIFGLAGVIWWLAFRAAPEVAAVEPTNGASRSPLSPSDVSPPSTSGRNGAAAAHAQNGKAVVADPHATSMGSLAVQDVPWSSFFRSPAVLALIWAHFCNDWGKYALQSWLPTYYKSALHLTLTQASQIAILAPVAAVAFSGVAATLADNLIRRDTDVTKVRRLMQCISFFAPAVCMGLVTLLHADSSPGLVVALLTLGLGLSSFSLAGLYCTHQDISPKYAGILLGITNTAGAIPGFLGTALTGFLFDATQSWNLSLFVPSIVFYLAGALVWLFFASSQPQDFDAIELDRK